MKQEFIIERDDWTSSKPWKVKCVGDDGPFKPHVLNTYSTKREAQETVDAYNNFIKDEKNSAGANHDY